MGEVHGSVMAGGYAEEKGVRTGRTEAQLPGGTRQRSIRPPHFSGTLHMGYGTGHRAGTNSAWPGVQPETSRPMESFSGYCRVSGYERGWLNHSLPILAHFSSSLSVP